LQISNDNGSVVKASDLNTVESAAVATWQILYEFIQQRHPESARLLAVISVLEFQSIPVILLNMLSKDRKQVKTVISILVQFGMIIFFANQNSVSAGRLIQLCTKAWLTRKGERTWAEERALWLLTTAFPSVELFRPSRDYFDFMN
jgi:uncharacterized protein involved in response to NO